MLLARIIIPEKEGMGGAVADYDSALKYDSAIDAIVKGTSDGLMVVLNISAVLIVLVFILHVFAAVWTQGTIRAMTRGTVTGGWSWRHHRKWLRELARRQTSKPAE